MISALRPSSVNCRFPFLWKYSCLFSWTSFVPSTSVYTSSQCLWSSSCHSALSSVKCLLTYNYVSGFLFAFFFPGSELHVTRCSALAFLPCFLSIFRLIFAVHFAAASSRNLTVSGVLIFFSSLLSFGVVFSWPRAQCSSAQLKDLLSYCRRFSSPPFLRCIN